MQELKADEFAISGLGRELVNRQPKVFPEHGGDGVSTGQHLLAIRSKDPKVVNIASHDRITRPGSFLSRSV